MTEKLILEPYAKALESLQDVVAKPKDEYIRDATIQRFKYTFELSWKMIKRHMEWSGFGDTAPLTRKDLFREAAQICLIEGPERWFRYNRARNDSSHTYDQDVAEAVYEAAIDFVPDAVKLLEALQKYHD